jgi:poly [ADP-ribose] polymerase 6/8
MDPNNSKVTLLSPANKEFNRLNDILKKMPSVEKISAARDHSDMKSTLDRAHPLAFDLLQWIISSNRSHIVKLPPAKHVRSMITPHQYERGRRGRRREGETGERERRGGREEERDKDITEKERHRRLYSYLPSSSLRYLLMSAPPEREAKFRELKKKHGSVFAFHGSSLENWHCVLRLGLRNATGTKLQVNGAAYGNGIYLSPHAGTSFTYSKMSGNNQGTPSFGSGGNRFLQGKDVFCVAMCEVIDTADIRKKELIWVCPHEEHVLTRFFFVYLGPEAVSSIFITPSSDLYLLTFFLFLRARQLTAAQRRRRSCKRSRTRCKCGRDHNDQSRSTTLWTQCVLYVHICICDISSGKSIVKSSSGMKNSDRLVFV